MTITQLALTTGLTRQTIYSIEGTAPYRPSAEVMSRLAKALDVTIDDLMSREDAA